jgi:hypothetical protein
LNETPESMKSSGSGTRVRTVAAAVSSMAWPTLRAERRGYSPGGALDDWLQAEQDVKQRFESGRAASRQGILFITHQKENQHGQYQAL